MSIDAILPLDAHPLTAATADKPQSKVWEYAGSWWSVFSDFSDTYVWRLDGSSWTPVLQVSPSTAFRADVEMAGNVVHALLLKPTTTQLVSMEYVPALGTYQLWSARPTTVDLGLTDLETATIEVDSTGRMWTTYAQNQNIIVQYSDSMYQTWSSPITLASNVHPDDISVVAALPNGRIGVLWSNQTTDRFGFRYHVDGADPNVWSVDEVPASGSALNIGAGMADDHLNVAVASDGTLYAAIKTGYDTTGFTRIGLLVRRPNGTWDPLYDVETVTGTRPIVKLNETLGSLFVIYTSEGASSAIVSRESSTGAISFGPPVTLMNDALLNNASSAESPFIDDLVVIASKSGVLAGVRIVINPTVSLQDGVNGYAGTIDTTIRADHPTETNGGTANKIQAKDNPDMGSLLRWELPSIPVGSVVQSAAITLHITANSKNTYDVYELLRSWTETGANWDQYAAGTPWGTAGAQQIGVDRAAAVLASVTAPTNGFVTINLNSAGIAMVQKWINDPSTNHGITIQNYVTTTKDDLAFDSSEAGTAANRPKLSIKYSTDGSINHPPTANSNAYSVNSGATLNANDATGTVGGTNDDGVLVNDTDPENNGLSAILVAGPTHASAFTLNPNGTFTYTPNNDSVSSDSFTYCASDGLNQSNIATVTITINPGGGTTTTVSLQDGVNGYTGTIDTTIRADHPTSTSESTANKIQAKDKPDIGSLLRWELPSIPVGSIVQSASITLRITNDTKNTYELYELLRSWTEADASWNQSAAGTPWGTAGAQQIGVDRAAAVLASLTAPTNGLVTLNLNSDGIAMVQKWINTPSTNHGVTIQDYVTTTGDDVAFDSSEATTAANRPKLTITYSAGGPINNPPTITTTAIALADTENDPATAIDPGLTTSDPDSANYVGATVSITGGFASGQDVLGFTNQNGISGAYNAATGVLTLSGTSSVANYQAALRSVTYVNTSENPSAANRTVTFSVNDGALTGSAFRTISVTPVNDAPTAINNAYSVNQGTILNVNDAAGTVGGMNDDSVLVNDTDPESNSLTAVKVTDPTHGTLTLNANGTFTYTHNNDTATSDSFTYQASDGSSQSNIVTVTITINPSEGATTTVSMQDGINGYVGTIDTTIKANFPTATTGASATSVEALDDPDRGALLRWELPSIPTGSIVQSASITLWVTNGTTANYELYELLRSWTEGSATWNECAAGTPWGTPGAQQLGVDRGSAVLASLTAANNTFVTLNLNSDGIAMVQKWIDTPSTNHGVTIQSYVTATGNSVAFDSSESITAANRPKLTITYGPGSPLIAASTASVTSSAQTGSTLTEAALARIGQEAVARWLTISPADRHDAIRTAASSITFAIADLPGQTLGTSFGNMILIDHDAAGFGWFIDRTPGDDREFDATHDASPTSSAFGHMDLLSVVAHEIGHLLGFDHDSELVVMHDSLEAGHRTIAIDAFFQGVGWHDGEPIFYSFY